MNIPFDRALELWVVETEHSFFIYEDEVTANKEVQSQSARGPARAFRVTESKAKLMQKPKRRYEVEIRIGGDTEEDVKSALNHIMYAFHEKAGVRGPMVSGGTSSNFNVELVHTPEQTHENYFKQLNEYLEKS